MSNKIPHNMTFWPQSNPRLSDWCEQYDVHECYMVEIALDVTEAAGHHIAKFFCWDEDKPGVVLQPFKKFIIDLPQLI